MILNPITKKQIDAFVSSPANSLLIRGNQSSASLVALDICSRVIDQKLSAGNSLIITPKDKSISIDDVREIKSYLKLKHSKTGKISRVVVVNATETMTNEAQNAILKILEEPPADTLIVLCANTAQNLLSTIVSRCIIIRIIPVSLDAAITFYDKRGFEKAEIAKNYLLCGGDGAILDALLSGNNVTDTLSHIQKAKEIISTPVFARLATINSVLKDEASLEPTISAIGTILRSVMSQQLALDKPVSKQLLKKIEAVNEANEALAWTPNKKLLLTNLFLNI